MMESSPESFALLALSPLDGRYTRETEALRNYFSEFGYLRDRARVEVEYLMALSRDAQIVRSITDQEEKVLRALVTNFDAADAKRIKVIEATTWHDVKAIEYWLREKLLATSLSDAVAWLHFGLTSEDVNQTALALALRDSRDAVMLPALDDLITRIATLARKHKMIPMLARTHGQPAVPTTLGKEIAVFYARLKKQRALLREHRFEAKLTGAVGNFSALAAAAPDVDWRAFSENFIRTLGLEPNLITTQILPYDNWIRYFDTLRLTNSICLDLAQDLWGYTSQGYFQLRAVEGEVGSSTMPQKVNPTDFENAEGNLGIANALFAHYAQKLAVSRLQRDLSDSTVRRTFGVALGHTLLACNNLTRGLERIEANQEKLRADLDAHWEVVSEGAQTILRAAGDVGAYEQLKSLTRGKKLTRDEFRAWVAGLNIDEDVKARLHALTPENYVGLAVELVEKVLDESQ